MRPSARTPGSSEVEIGLERAIMGALIQVPTLIPLLREAGSRVHELHLRNSNQKLWLEALGDGDIDYRQVAGYLKQTGLTPLLTVELAYRKETVVTRSLEDDLRLSRIYAVLL